jgi:hypothetical protein
MNIHRYLSIGHSNTILPKVHGYVLAHLANFRLGAPTLGGTGIRYYCPILRIQL